MKQLTLEEIQQYKRKYSFLEECSFSAWEDVEDAMNLVRIKVGCIALTKLMKELEMECANLEFPVNGLDDDGYVDCDDIDSIWHYSVLLEELRESVYSQGGWAIDIIPIYSILEGYFEQSGEDKNSMTKFQYHELVLPEEDIKILWDTELRTFFSEYSLTDDFDFIAPKVYECVKLMLEGSYVISEMILYRNSMLGKYKVNKSMIEPINKTLDQVITTLSEEVRCPNALEVEFLCRRGYTDRSEFAIIQTSFQDESTGENVDSISLSLHTMMNAIMLDQALKLMKMQQPELFYDYVEEKVGVCASA